MCVGNGNVCIKTEFTTKKAVFKKAIIRGKFYLINNQLKIK